jgi:hypothetical protein
VGENLTRDRQSRLVCGQMVVYLSANARVVRASPKLRIRRSGLGGRRVSPWKRCTGSRVVPILRLSPRTYEAAGRKTNVPRLEASGARAVRASTANELDGDVGRLPREASASSAAYSRRSAAAATAAAAPTPPTRSRFLLRQGCELRWGERAWLNPSGTVGLAIFKPERRRLTGRGRGQARLVSTRTTCRRRRRRRRRRC